MCIEDFIESYYEDYGQYPSERVIMEYLSYGNSNQYQQSFNKPNSLNQSKIYNQNCHNSAEDLLVEIKGIFSGIAHNVQISSHAKEFAMENNTFNEFNLMLMIFLSKSALYFLLKHSYNRGYDFSNL